MASHRIASWGHSPAAGRARRHVVKEKHQAETMSDEKGGEHTETALDWLQRALSSRHAYVVKGDSLSSMYVRGLLPTSVPWPSVPPARLSVCRAPNAHAHACAVGRDNVVLGFESACFRRATDPPVHSQSSPPTTAQDSVVRRAAAAPRGGRAGALPREGVVLEPCLCNTPSSQQPSPSGTTDDARCHDTQTRCCAPCHRVP